MTRKIKALPMLLFCMIFLAGIFSGGKKAVYAADLDEIVNYEITVEPNEHATLTMTYHIDWKVLDSDSEGPLSWVTVGIPNSNYESYRGLSDTVKKISYTSSGGSYLRIDFDRDYYEDEIVSFDFEVIQDYMYEMNMLTEGETVYQFTPGWFDSLVVDSLTIRWKSDQAKSWSPSCLTKDG